MNKRAVNLLTRFRNEFKLVPADKVDMDTALGYDGCGCIAFHVAENSNNYPFASVYNKLINAGISENNTSWLLNNDCKSYKHPVGQKGKTEALRRLSYLIKKYSK